MARLGGVDELRRSAGRGQGGGDLAGDMPALADAGDDQPAAGRGAQVERLSEGAVEGARELFQSLDLGADDPAGHREVAVEAVGSPPTGTPAKRVSTATAAELSPKTIPPI